MPNKITKLTLGEISEVTKPAQADAIATIMKAADASIGDMVSWNSSGGTARGKIERVVRDGSIDVPGSSFTVSAEDDDPAVLIRVYRDGEPTDTRVGHKMSTLRKSADEIGQTIIDAHARAIDGADASQVAKASAEARDAIRDLCPEAQDELIEVVEKASAAAGDHPVSAEVTMSDNTPEVAKLQEQLGDLQKSLDAEKASRADAEVIAKMTDAEKAYMDGLDDDKRKAFKAMSAQERADAMKVAKAADEVIELNGKEIRKSQAGDMFEVLKAQAEEIASVRKAQADAEARAEMVELRKRADDEFANCGNVDAVASLLKAAGSLSDADRATLEGIMKAANDSAIFTAQGVSDATVAKSGHAKLDDAVAEVRKAHPDLSEAQAMVKALEANPALYDA